MRSVTIDSARRVGCVLTPALLALEPALEVRLDQQFFRAPHPFSEPVHGLGLRLDALADLVPHLAPSLLPAGVRDAVFIRRLRFVTGRVCAERALLRYGVLGTAVGQDCSGAPMWPAGVTGSITHNATHAYAVLCPQIGARAIGIDSETIVDEAALRDLRQVCCTQGENANWFRGGLPHLTATLIFSAKEALYKAIHALVRRVVDFCEVEVVAIDWQRRQLWLAPVPGGALAAQIPHCQARFRVVRDTAHIALTFDPTAALQPLPR